MNIINFDTIDSTNYYLKNNYKNFDNLTVCRANHQTKGHGRFDRKWLDNDDLLFSILIKEKLDNPTMYSFMIAQSIIDALNDYNIEAFIKWPNDIIVNDKKICGILLEAETTDAINCVVIGIGLNVNTKEFSDDLLIKATSILNECGKPISKMDLLDHILNYFNDYYTNDINYIERVIEKNYLLYKNIKFKYNNELIEGVCGNITTDGRLEVMVNNRTILLNSGEVTLNSIYKS